MNHFFTLLLLLGGAYVTAQETPTAQAQAFVEEGKRLYRSEMASWYGKDLFLASYAEPSNIGGYFSYTLGDTSRCIFFSKQSDPVVIGAISFDSTYQTETARKELAERPFTALEYSLFRMREQAITVASTDTLFRRYESTNFNFIPLVGDSKKVYVLTGPTKTEWYYLEMITC